MSEKEIKDLKKQMKSFKAAVTRSKETSIEFLNDIGVTNDKGELRKQYKHLCTPPKRG